MKTYFYFDKEINGLVLLSEDEAKYYIQAHSLGSKWVEENLSTIEGEEEESKRLVEFVSLGKALKMSIFRAEWKDGVAKIEAPGIGKLTLRYPEKLK